MRRLLRVDGKGAASTLGPLETDVMREVWRAGGWVSVSDVMPAFAAKLNNIDSPGTSCALSAGGLGTNQEGVSASALNLGAPYFEQLQEEYRERRDAMVGGLRGEQGSQVGS